MANQLEITVGTLNSGTGQGSNSQRVLLVRDAYVSCYQSVSDDFLDQFDDVGDLLDYVFDIRDQTGGRMFSGDPMETNSIVVYTDGAFDGYFKLIE